MTDETKDALKLAREKFEEADRAAATACDIGDRAKIREALHRAECAALELAKARKAANLEKGM